MIPRSTAPLATALIAFVGASSFVLPISSFAETRPNVLFIAVDDLNDWIGCLGGHPQTVTPNFDRLAKSGVLFTNAYCAAPACNPSRSAILSGIPPHQSGLYHNGQVLRDVLPDAVLMPRYFSNHGYRSAGSGKLLHYIIDARSWDDYFPAKEKEDPFPRTFYPKERPVNLPVGGPWQYVETDWAALDVTDEEYGGDWLVTKWIGEQLTRDHEKPFFLACGIYRPHEPWFVPAKYFEPFPLESIQLPPGYREDDLDDLPPSGQKMGPNRYFEQIQNAGQWKKGIQAYLASIHFADAMLGRVLDALDNGPHKDHTVVVLWSDHGWHLGEKQHWQKFTGWRLCDRVPLMVRVPKGTPGLPGGTTAGSICERTVNLVDLFTTLTELCGLPPKDGISNTSLVPLLKNPEAEWDHPGLTQINGPEAYAVSTEQWRLIHYTNGDEELYDIASDPYEWTNLLHGATASDHSAKADELRALAPKNAVPVPEVPTKFLPKLQWHPVAKGAAPPSKTDGNPFEVIFINDREEGIELLWMDRDGNPRPYGQIGAAKSKKMQTRPGTVWMIRDADGHELGHFVVGDRTARAVITP